MCDIPVFHDDQHGTAIVVAAALLNAVKVTKKEMGKLKIVINGAGAAGIAIGKHLINMGFGNVIMCDINGIICEGDEGLNPGQEEISHISNLNHEHGKLADALKGADAFIGVSRPNLVTKEMVSTMNNGIVFAMANPVPEIMPDLRGEESQIGPYSAVRLRFPAWHGNPARDVRPDNSQSYSGKETRWFPNSGSPFQASNPAAAAFCL